MKHKGGFVWLLFIPIIAFYVVFGIAMSSDTAKTESEMKEGIDRQQALVYEYYDIISQKTKQLEWVKENASDIDVSFFESMKQSLEGSKRVYWDNCIELMKRVDEYNKYRKSFPQKWFCKKKNFEVKANILPIE